MTVHLVIQSPSPTTISYTVSNKRSASKLLATIRYGLRFLFVFHTILVNLVRAQKDELLPGWEIYVDWLLKFTLLDPLVLYLATSTDSTLLGGASLFVIYLCLRRGYIEESLLVVQGLGIQTSTSSPYYFLGSTTSFISTTKIQDIVIHEAFKGLEVRFYLAVIVEDASEVLVVFPDLLPRRDILEEVWRGARKCLYAGG